MSDISDKFINLLDLSVGPLIKGQRFEKDIGIWIKGEGKNDFYTYGVIQLDDRNLFIIELRPENDYIYLKKFSNLSDGEHKYRAGYFFSKENNLDNDNFNWNTILYYYFNIDTQNKLNFCFGSCRKLVRFKGYNLFGTGKEGDIIYKTIKDQPCLDFFMNIGDKVYFDFMGGVKYKTLDQKRKIYQTVYNFDYHKQLHQELQGYDICDDNDIQMRNAGQKTKNKYPLEYKDGVKAYYEYQHIDGPLSAQKKFYYIFEKKNASFFVFDTRSERKELLDTPQIISKEQEIYFKEWIQDDNLKNKIKFVVSSVPMISQKGKDSWYAFPLQQRKILRYMCDVENVFILTGDAHCARLAVYNIYKKDDSISIKKENGEFLGSLTEIVSSGLVALSHDKGKMFTRYNNHDDYDKNNDFPKIIDQTGKGGLRMVTKFSSTSYPNPHKAKGIIQNIKNTYKNVVDNVFVKITQIEDNKLKVSIINQYNYVLHNLKLDLSTKEIERFL